MYRICTCCGVGVYTPDQLDQKCGQCRNVCQTSNDTSEDCFFATFGQNKFYNTPERLRIDLKCFSVGRSVVCGFESPFLFVYSDNMEDLLAALHKELDSLGIRNYELRFLEA